MIEDDVMITRPGIVCKKCHENIEDFDMDDEVVMSAQDHYCSRCAKETGISDDDLMEFSLEQVGKMRSSGEVVAAEPQGDVIRSDEDDSTRLIEDIKSTGLISKRLIYSTIIATVGSMAIHVVILSGDPISAERLIRSLLFNYFCLYLLFGIEESVREKLS